MVQPRKTAMSSQVFDTCQFCGNKTKTEVETSYPAGQGSGLWNKTCNVVLGIGCGLYGVAW